MIIFGYSLETNVENLGWAALLKGEFEFRTDELTVDFWQASYRPRHIPPSTFDSAFQPSTTLLAGSVIRDWTEQQSDIEGTAH